MKYLYIVYKFNISLPFYERNMAILREIKVVCVNVRLS